MCRTLFLLAALATVTLGETDSAPNNQNNFDASANSKKHSEKEYRIQGEKQLNAVSSV